MKPTWLQTAEPAPTGSGRSIALDSAGSSAIFFYARIPAGPGRGEGAGGAGAIAHIKSSSRRGAINAHVPKTHVVTPITDDHSCTTRNAPVRGRASQTASCGRGILPLAAEDQREALEAMTGGAVAREVATPPAALRWAFRSALSSSRLVTRILASCRRFVWQRIRARIPGGYGP